MIELFLSRKTKVPRRPTSKQIYPLTGLLKCGSCGYYMGLTERTDRKGLLSVKKCWYVDTYGVKCSNRSGPLNKVIEKVNKKIEEHIEYLEEEIDNVDTKRLVEIEAIIKGNKKY